jgi:lauroyl/myristoyl acyltransferase
LGISIAALGYRGLAWCCARLPVGILQIVAKPVSKIYHHFDKGHVVNVRKNLAIISEHTKRDCSHLEKKVYEHFAYFMIEFFRAGSIGKVEVPERVKELTNQHLGLPGEKANLILVGHYGNWEISLKHLLELGYSVTIIAMNHSNKDVDAFFTKMRAHKNVKISYLDQGLRPCIKAIKNKEVLALACERDYTGNGIEVDIAGHKVKFPNGPSWLIDKYKLDAYLGLTKRISLGVFESNLVKIKSFDADTSHEEITQEISDQLFKHIFENPEQWITFDDFFK